MDVARLSKRRVYIGRLNDRDKYTLYMPKCLPIQYTKFCMSVLRVVRTNKIYLKRRRILRWSHRTWVCRSVELNRFGINKLTAYMLAMVRMVVTSLISNNVINVKTFQCPHCTVSWMQICTTNTIYAQKKSKESYSENTHFQSQFYIDIHFYYPQIDLPKCLFNSKLIYELIIQFSVIISYVYV